MRQARLGQTIINSTLNEEMNGAIQALPEEDQREIQPRLDDNANMILSHRDQLAVPGPQFDNGQPQMIY